RTPTAVCGYYIDCCISISIVVVRRQEQWREKCSAAQISYATEIAFIHPLHRPRPTARRLPPLLIGEFLEQVGRFLGRDAGREDEPDRRRDIGDTPSATVKTIFSLFLPIHASTYSFSFKCARPKGR